MKKAQQWKTRLAACLLAGGLGLTGAAQATLIDRGSGLIYDDVLDVTWLQDANYAHTSGYATDDTVGRMTWDNAVAWAGGLSYYDTVRATTWDDWRLPSTVDTGIPGCPSTVSYSGADCGYNVLTGSAATTVYSEIASLWYDTLGNIARWDTSGNNNQPGWGLSNTGADGVNFMHLKGDLYWSAEYPLDTDDGRWKINTRTGLQRNQIKDNSTNFAWAVRSGDVAAVPEPGTVVLMALGLVGLGLGRRRRLAA